MSTTQILKEKLKSYPNLALKKRLTRNRTTGNLRCCTSETEFILMHKPSWGPCWPRCWWQVQLSQGRLPMRVAPGQGAGNGRLRCDTDHTRRIWGAGEGTACAQRQWLQKKRRVEARGGMEGLQVQEALGKIRPRKSTHRGCLELAAATTPRTWWPFRHLLRTGFYQV